MRIAFFLVAFLTLSPAPADAQERSVSAYEILGVSEDATDAEIAKRYRALAQKLHPEANHGADALTRAKLEEELKRVNGAHERLKTPEKRARYDRERRPKKSAAVHRPPTNSSPPPRPPKPAPENPKPARDFHQEFRAKLAEKNGSFLDILEKADESFRTHPASPYREATSRFNDAKRAFFGENAFPFIQSEPPASDVVRFLEGLDRYAGDGSSAMEKAWVRAAMGTLSRHQLSGHLTDTAFESFLGRLLKNPARFADPQTGDFLLADWVRDRIGLLEAEMARAPSRADSARIRARAEHTRTLYGEMRSRLHGRLLNPARPAERFRIPTLDPMPPQGFKGCVSRAFHALFH